MSAQTAPDRVAEPEPADPSEPVEMEMDAPVDEPVDEPAEEPIDEPDPRDQIIANQEKLLEVLAAQRDAPAAEPEGDDLEAQIAELGFNAVPSPVRGEDGSVSVGALNMTASLAKLLTIAENRALARFRAEAGQKFRQIDRTLTGNKYEGAVVRHLGAAPDARFNAFEAAEYERDPTLGKMRDNGAAEHAAEMVVARFKAKQARKAVTKGNDLRARRMSGATLTDGAPRGSNNSTIKLTVSRRDPDYGRKLDEFVRRGGDARNFTTTR